MAASGLRAFGYGLPEGQLDSMTELLERFATMENAAYEQVISRQSFLDSLDISILGDSRSSSTTT